MAFLKFIDKEDGASNFLSGNLRLGLVKEYRNQENSATVGKQDFEEGRFFTQKYTIPNGSPINVRFEPDEDIGHALCLYHMSDVPDVKGLKRMTEFGNYVVIIKDEHEFIRRLDIAVKEMAYFFEGRDIFYYSESIEDEREVMRLLSLRKEYFSFLKREADFSYQKEYRYLVVKNHKSEEKWIEIKIGDLSDIAEIQLSDFF
jgi:hypothetical protein